jgi:hypothetical protein
MRGTVTLCLLTTDDEPRCAMPAVVAVRDRDRDSKQRWGCEQHALAALGSISRARISQVAKWDACGRRLRPP